MQESPNKQDAAAVAEEQKTPRIRGVGNPESHSQDADRHRKQEHPESGK